MFYYTGRLPTNKVWPGANSVGANKKQNAAPQVAGAE